MSHKRTFGKKIRNFLCSIVMVAIVLFVWGNSAKAEEVLKLYGKVDDYKRVLLQWESHNEESIFEIQRKTDGEEKYTTVAEVSGQTGTVTYYDHDVKLGKKYYYKLVMLTGIEGEKESKEVMVKVILPAPSGVKAKIIKNTSVQISWNKVKKADSYIVYRSKKQKSGFKKIAAVKKAAYTDCDVKKGTMYYYKIVANYKKEKSYSSAKSEAASVHLKPEAPKVVGSYFKKKIKLTWEKITGADIYYIYKKNTKDEYEWIGETNKLYYSDSKVKKGKTYVYKVLAVSKAGDEDLKGEEGSPCKVKAAAIDPDKKMVALTFDDGPGRYTKDIVRCLKDNQSKATFFVLGCNIDAYEDALSEADKIGCEIGNHSYSHADLTKLSVDQIQAEISRTDKKVKKVTGKTPSLVRTPGGSLSTQVEKTVNKPIILWSIDTLDWKHRDKDKTIHTVMSEVKDGDIVLMHDIYEPTKEAACSLIATLRREGYQLVTVSELAEYRGLQLEKGSVYHSLRRIK